MRFYFLFILLIIGIGANAQDTLRIEITQRFSDPQPQVVPVGIYGLVLIEHERDMLPGTISLVHYDTLLIKNWEGEVSFGQKLELVNHQVYKDKLYLLFNNEDEPILEVAVISLVDGIITSYQFSYFERFSAEAMCIKNGEMYVAGLLRKLPVAIRLQFDTPKLESLPMAVNGKHVEIEEMVVSNKETVAVTISFEKSGNREVLIKEYSDDNTSSDILISPTDEYDLINGKISNLGAKSKIVIGTYGYRNNDATQGFYIGGYYNGQEVFKKYHNYNDLENFYSYRGLKEKERIEERIDKKKKQGRDLKSKYRLLTHEVLTQNESYIMLGEAYFPTYRQQQVRRYSPRGYYYENRIVFDGFKYTHAVIIAFSKKGDILWDYSFKINNIKSMDLKEHVRVNVNEEVIQLIYNNEGKINVMSLRGGKMEFEDLRISLPSKYVNDQIKYSDLGQSEHWYGNHYLAWGYQRITNLDQEGGNKKRNVFYINKLSF